MKFAKGANCIMAALLLAAGIAAALTPALARPAASSSWAGRIPAQQTESGEEKLSLFEKERQTVLLGAKNGEFEIPLEPNAGEYRVTDPGDDRWVKVQLAEDGSALRAKSYLDRMLTADGPQPSDTTQAQTTEETAEQTTKAEKSEPEGTVAEPAAEEETTAPPTEQDETPVARPDGISFTVVCTGADGTEKEASFVLAASAEYTLQGTVLLEKEQYLYADQTAEDGERIYDAYVTLLADETGVQTPSPCSVMDVNDSNVDTLCFEDCDTALLNRPPLQTLLELFIRRKQGHMIAFLQENRVVGYLSYFEMFEDTYDVDHIYVAENKRGQGIGTALAKAYVARAIADCKNAFWSSVNPISAKTAKAAGSKLCSRRIFIEKQLTDATEERS